MAHTASPTDSYQLRGNPKAARRSVTQTLSLIVGFVLFVLGLSAIFYSGVWGMHIGVPYALITMAAGAILFHNGNLNNSRYSLYTCLGFGIFFGLHALAGFVAGRPGVHTVGYEQFDDKILVIIPRFHELGTADHVLNLTISAVLLAGALDWRRQVRKQRLKKHLLRDC